MVALRRLGRIGDIQHSFAARLMAPRSELPSAISAANNARAQSGFAVYRNNVRFGLVKALGARFPTVLRLLGEDAFLQIAGRFVAGEPPRSPLVMFYGDRFPAFLREIGGVASAGFVADIAAIEAARTRAYHAADAPAVSHDAFAAPGVDLAAMSVTLHPSATLLRLETPAVTGWQANQPGSDNRIRQWRAEDALIARPRLEVGVWTLPDGCFEFLGALATGATFSDAAATAGDGSKAFDLAESLALLISAEIVTAIH